jgi:signal transduction histidine kinase
MSLLSSKFFLANEHRLLGMMLLSLLLALFFSDNINLSRSLFVSHFGFFLLWQPIYSRRQRFSLGNLLVLLAFIGVFVFWFNKWLIPFWMLMLLSLLTGRIFSRGLGRLIYGLAIIILFLQLILITTPSLFNLHGFPQRISTGIEIYLIISAIPILFIGSPPHLVTNVDFIRGFLVVMLTLFLCLGSVLVTFTTQQPYLQSLAGTIILAALFLFATSILWSPRGGFTGLAQMWEKYLLNIGGPFEQWISQLAALEANTSLDPDLFLQASVNYLRDRHWISGISWTTEKDTHTEGVSSRYSASTIDSRLKLTLYAHSPIGPALMLHSKLLLSVLTFYYKAKLQEQLLTKQAHLRAIYETGSRLTHDVKNILQSTNTLTQIVMSEDAGSDESNQLLRKQLPMLTQRLKTTLDKLGAPSTSDTGRCSLSQWWQDLQLRYAGREIQFNDTIKSDIEIPQDAFNTVVENLLENARTKRISQPGINISVSVISDDQTVSFVVCDTGHAIPESITANMFREIISSNDGFGIGLYQSSQLAGRAGYNLELSENIDGSVCFTMLAAEH